MRSLIAAPLVALLSLSGCAHTTETHESTVMSVSAPPPAQPQGDVIAVDQQYTQEAPPPPARPRLTQTITLGQSNNEATYSPPPPSQGQGTQNGNTQNVIVNNNVVVNQPPAVYGGWGGYGGYGSYGYGYRGGSGARVDGVGRGGTTGSATWGNTGWEGARGRPAAGGATPGVGGNWGSAPSYGPSQMK